MTHVNRYMCVLNVGVGQRDRTVGVGLHEHRLGLDLGIGALLALSGHLCSRARKECQHLQMRGWRHNNARARQVTLKQRARTVLAPKRRHSSASAFMNLAERYRSASSSAPSPPSPLFSPSAPPVPACASLMANLHTRTRTHTTAHAHGYGTSCEGDERSVSR
jgi:hypothetical protein